jgi:hypothetical protein
MRLSLRLISMTVLFNIFSNVTLEINRQPVNDILESVLAKVVEI